jgi:hypothetical protein
VDQAVAVGFHQQIVRKEIMSIEDRTNSLEELVNQIGITINNDKYYPEKTQQVSFPAMHKALCVSTLDPWKRNRVRYYHPIFNDPDTQIGGLPYAWPVSAQGGFDDCGCNWVPPAASTLVLFFENGDRTTAYYIGTTWQGDRGAGGSTIGFPVQEYSDIYNGHRDGYLVGPNDESQVFPQWNTESYNNFDTTSIADFVTDTSSQQKMTYPNIYGWKTPEKHMIKMVDGNAKCDRRWKRIEIQSGCGNWMIFKDDHLHYGGQWGHPTCAPKPSAAGAVVGGITAAAATGAGPDVSLCSNSSGGQPFFTDPTGQPIEMQNSCQGTTSSGNIIGGHPSTPSDPPDPDPDQPLGTPVTKYVNSNKGSNPYFKHKNECRPIMGPQTPQNNRIDLPQSGIQFLSISGHTMVLDDSVEEPSGSPTWERSTKAFDFGCNNKYLGVFYFKSATGHSFTMSDVEEDSGLRGDQNYIELKTATGNSIQLNDHTIGEPNCEACPPNYAGDQRGIHLQSTSNHQINMNDNMNQQCGVCRKEGGTPTAAATQAYVNIKTGYGLEMRFSDDFSQQQTDSQWIMITNPQCSQQTGDTQCNTTRGPHFMRFQARPQGTPGVIFLRAGGHAIRSTYDMDIVLVGDLQNNPSDKFTYVSRMCMHATEQTNFRYAGQLHILFAEQQILLMAGRDCSPAPGKKCDGPCLYPVIVARCPWICPYTDQIHWTDKAMSERVFASAKNIDCGSGAVIPPTGNSSPGCSDDNTTTTVNTGAGTVTTTSQPTNPQTVMTPTLPTSSPGGSPSAN